jgi:RimJ/RimL family protein N-acetyltransferase
MAVEPPLPSVALPVQASTPAGDLVRIRRFVDAEPRPDSSSEYDDWGVFDIHFEEDWHDRAMVDIRPRGGADEAWVAVGDMSWHSELHGPNLGSRAISIGVSLHADVRGRGIGTVAQSLLAGALHRAGVHRVQASTDVANMAEQRSLERAGFVREGVARGSQVRADGRHDLVLYSCLPGEPTFAPE